MSARTDLLALAARTKCFSMKVARDSVSVAPNSIPPLLNQMVRDGELVRVGYGSYAAPDKADDARASGTSGPAAQAILRALGKASHLPMDELCRVAHAHTGGDTVRAIVGLMVRQGLVQSVFAGYAITARGAKRIPSAPPVMPVIRPYIPPKMPPRRPGSMTHMALPSVYAGSARA